MSIRVLLADDQALLRGTFRLLLESAPDITVVGEASTGTEAVAQTRAERPDIVLMDIRMPELNGVEATRRITADEDLAAVRIVILTTFETEELVLAGLRAGASAFLGKGVDPGSLLAAIRTVAAGDQLLSPAATRTLIDRVIAEREPQDPVALEGLDELTDREREVTALVGAGLSNDEIAQRLFITPATAKTHVSRAMTKTTSRDRAQLVVFAYETGLVERSPR